MAQVIAQWRPEDAGFWQQEGRGIATRNLWISIPCLLLAFAVWMVWSAVTVRLNSIGFAFTTDHLFWLAALPGLAGATLRIFYSFMVPIFGGRLWTTLSTASLLIPAFGIGCAVLAGAISPHRCRTSVSSSPKRRRATHWRSTPGWAISAYR